MLGGLQQQHRETVAHLEGQAANIATLQLLADFGKAITRSSGWWGRLVRWIIGPNR
jgi:hypothetical protein